MFAAKMHFLISIAWLASISSCANASQGTTTKAFADVAQGDESVPDLTDLNTHVGACGKIFAFAHNDSTAITVNIRGVEALDLIPDPETPKSATRDLTRSSLTQVTLAVREPNSPPFAYCRDIVISGDEPRVSGVAVSGFIDISTMYDPDLAVGYRATLVLRNVVFRSVDGSEFVHLDHLEIPNVHWGWSAG